MIIRFKKKTPEYKFFKYGGQIVEEKLGSPRLSTFSIDEKFKIGEEIIPKSRHTSLRKIVEDRSSFFFKNDLLLVLMEHRSMDLRCKQVKTRGNGG